MSKEQRLPLGLYETLKTHKTQGLEIPENTEWVETELPATDAEHIPSLAKYIAQQVVAKLEQTNVSERISLVNSLLNKLGEDLGLDEIARPTDVKNAGNLIQLTELKPKNQTQATLRPVTPLSNVALLTNNPKEPRLGEELKRVGERRSGGLALLLLEADRGQRPSAST